MTDSNAPKANGRAAIGTRLSAEAKATLKAKVREVEPRGPHTLRQLRLRQRRTQAQVAEAMGTEQDRVSRLERRADARLSTLKDYIAALGGTLRLVVDFPDREPIDVRLPERDTASQRRPRKLKPTVD